MNLGAPKFTGTKGALGRAWDAPIGAHVLALAVVLGLGLWASGPLVAHSSDEGAAIMQARVLDRTGSWLIRNPIAALDPSASALPIPRADAGPKGRAPYAKHPLYPVVLLGFSKLFGNVGYWLSSALGTLVAAVLGARIARRLDRAAERPVLWAVGVATPLLFDATWVLAHSLAAAAFAVAALLVLMALSGSERRSPRRDFVIVGGAGAAVAIATGLRSEASIAGLALAAASATWAVRRRRLRGAVIGVVLIAFVGGTRLAERVAYIRILGGSPAQGLPGAQGSSGDFWLVARWHAAQVTLLRPGYEQSRTGVFLVLGAIALAGAAIAARQRVAVRFIIGFDVLAGGAYALGLLGPNHPDVPGLLVACPLVGAGLLCLRSDLPRSSAGLVIAIAAGLTVAGVLATEYAIGGGVEWGGRYFAVVLPLIVAALWPGVLRLEGQWRQALLVGLGATGLIVASLGLAAARQKHRSTRELFSEIASCATVAGSPGSGSLDGRPLVVSPLRLLPQLGWESYDSYQWLSPEPDQLRGYLDRAGPLGVRRLLLVTDGPTEVAGLGYREERSCPSPFVTIRVLVNDGAPA